MLQHEGVDPKRQQLEIVYSRHHCRATDAYAGLGVGRPWIRMKLPPLTSMEVQYPTEENNGEWIKREEPVTFDSVLYATVLAHEIGHNRGLRHKEMMPIKELEKQYRWASK